MESTATDKTIFPQDRPKDRGTDPIAACTVAFGIYAIIQYIFSFIFSGVPTKQSITPIERKISAKKRLFRGNGGLKTSTTPVFI